MFDRIGTFLAQENKLPAEVAKKLFTLFFFLFFCFGAKAKSFLTGNNFETTLLTGSVQIQCRDENGANSRVVNFQCRLSLLDPVEMDFFSGPDAVLADRVALISTWETGEIRTRSVGYNSITRRSTDKINLWISSLIQRPLLGIGINRIDYKMFRQGQPVNEGFFNVTVLRNPPVSCPHKTYYTSVQSDCDSQFTMCDRYFRDQDFCQNR